MEVTNAVWMKKFIDFQSLLERHGSLWHFVQKQMCVCLLCYHFLMTSSMISFVEY